VSPSLFRYRRTPAVPLDLLPRERALVAVQDKAGAWVAATDRAIVTADRRLDWVDVGHAQWLDEDFVLVVEPVDPAVPSLRLSLPQPGRLPETVHERVMASIVISRRVPVQGGSVRVVGRDGPDGELRWQVIADAGVDPVAPDVRRAADSAVTALRAELGR
jgi:hypothetical protein